MLSLHVLQFFFRSLHPSFEIQVIHELFNYFLNQICILASVYFWHYLLVSFVFVFLHINIFTFSMLTNIFSNLPISFSWSLTSSPISQIKWGFKLFITSLMFSNFLNPPYFSLIFLSSSPNPIIYCFNFSLFPREFFLNSMNSLFLRSKLSALLFISDILSNILCFSISKVFVCSALPTLHYITCTFNSINASYLLLLCSLFQCLSQLT
mgnify:CR=1 FL=1